MKFALLAASILLVAAAGCFPAAQEEPEPIPAAQLPAPTPAPVWEREETEGEFSYRVALQEGEKQFEGQVEIRTAGRGQPVSLTWNLGGHRGSESGPVGPAGFPGGLLSLGDEAVTAVLEASLLSPLLDQDLILEVGWKTIWEDDGVKVEVEMSDQTTVLGIDGYVSIWKVTGPGLDMEMEIVISPNHPFPLSVKVVEAEPDQYELLVTLAR